jgi:quinoprotein dehydrogenase-associated probable ABC transporter substrate-binding protein
VEAIAKGEQNASPVQGHAAPGDRQDHRVLHVYADPDNLPFSNRNLEGFENKIAELVARDLGVKLEYTWLVQHRGFFRESLKEGDGDLVMGMPVDFEKALPTSPYYRSTYVFVYRKDSDLHLRTFSDPALKKLKIGIQIVGGDNTPPAHALAANGLIDNVVGYPVFVHEGQSPSAKLVQDVAQGVIDVAVMWGPPGAYYAKKQPVPLEVSGVGEIPELPALRFAFDISMGVRKRDKALRDKLNDLLSRRHQEIQKILDDYGVPRAPAGPQSSAASGLRH